MLDQDHSVSVLTYFDLICVYTNSVFSPVRMKVLLGIVTAIIYGLFFIDSIWCPPSVRVNVCFSL